MTCGLERSPTWSFLLLFLHFHKIYFSLLHFYTWGRQFSLFPCNPIRVKIGSMNCVELLWSSDVTKSGPNFGPVGWGSSSYLAVHFSEMPLPPFLYFLSFFLPLFSSLLTPLSSSSLLSSSLNCSPSSSPSHVVVSDVSGSDSEIFVRFVSFVKVKETTRLESTAITYSNCRTVQVISLACAAPQTSLSWYCNALFGYRWRCWKEASKVETEKTPQSKLFSCRVISRGSFPKKCHSFETSFFKL